jgi:hypothetical protein
VSLLIKILQVCAKCISYAHLLLGVLFGWLCVIAYLRGEGGIEYAQAFFFSAFMAQIFAPRRIIGFDYGKDKE